jgi:hypothetical protein
LTAAGLAPDHVPPSDAARCGQSKETIEARNGFHGAKNNQNAEMLMNAAKPTIVIYLVAFVGIFIWAAMTDPTLGGFLAALREPWGLVVTLDFFFGCLLLSWIIYYVEGSARVALPWAVALFIVGNIVGAIYLLTRLDRIRQRLAATA